MAAGKAILNALRKDLNLAEYRKKHWEGSFDEYIDVVREHPEITRTAYQRLYDMILSHGTEEVYEHKQKITRYKFFSEFAAQHADAIYVLDRPLMDLVNCFKSAASGYGTERRVLLCMGQGAQSTIACLLKKLTNTARPTQECSARLPGKGKPATPGTSAPCTRILSILSPPN